MVSTGVHWYFQTGWKSCCALRTNASEQQTCVGLILSLVQSTQHFPPNIVTEHFGREILCAVQRHTNAPDKSEVDFPPISSFVLSSFQSGKGSQTNVSCVLCNLKWSLAAFYENNCLIWRTGPWLNSPEKKDCDVSGCFGLQHQQSPSFGWPSTICPTGNPWVKSMFTKNKIRQIIQLFKGNGSPSQTLVHASHWWVHILNSNVCSNVIAMERNFTENVIHPVWPLLQALSYQRVRDGPCECDVEHVEETPERGDVLDEVGDGEQGLHRCCFRWLLHTVWLLLSLLSFYLLSLSLSGPVVVWK